MNSKNTTFSSEDRKKFIAWNAYIDAQIDDLTQDIPRFRDFFIDWNNKNIDSETAWLIFSKFVKENSSEIDWEAGKYGLKISNFSSKSINFHIFNALYMLRGGFSKNSLIDESASITTLTTGVKEAANNFLITSLGQYKSEHLSSVQSSVSSIKPHNNRMQDFSENMQDQLKGKGYIALTQSPIDDFLHKSLFIAFREIIKIDQERSRPIFKDVEEGIYELEKIIFLKISHLYESPSYSEYKYTISCIVGSKSGEIIMQSLKRGKINSPVYEIFSREKFKGREIKISLDVIFWSAFHGIRKSLNKESKSFTFLTGKSAKNKASL